MNCPHALATILGRNIVERDENAQRGSSTSVQWSLVVEQSYDYNTKHDQNIQQHKKSATIYQSISRKEQEQQEKQDVSQFYPFCKSSHLKKSFFPARASKVDEVTTGVACAYGAMRLRASMIDFKSAA